MRRRLILLIVVAVGLSLAPAPARADDYGGGVGTWSTSPKALKHRTKDGCTPEEFRARLEIPVLVVESEDHRYTGPLVLAGVGGTSPCWWSGGGGGWVELADRARGCRFQGVWFDFTWSALDTVVVSLLGNCGAKQLELFTEMVVAAGKATGPVILSNCY